MLIYLFTITTHYEEDPQSVTTVEYIASTREKLEAYITNELRHLALSKKQIESIKKKLHITSVAKVLGDDWCIEERAVDAQYELY